MGRLGGANVANPGAVCPLSQRTPAVPGGHWRKPHRGAMLRLPMRIAANCRTWLVVVVRHAFAAHTSPRSPPSMRACIRIRRAYRTGGGGIIRWTTSRFGIFRPRPPARYVTAMSNACALGHGHAPYGDGLPRHGSRPAYRRIVRRMGASQGFGQGTSNIIEYVATVQPSRYTRHFSWMDPDFLETLFPITMNYVDSRTECVHSGPPPSPPHNHGYRVRSR